MYVGLHRTLMLIELLVQRQQENDLSPYYYPHTIAMHPLIILFTIERQTDLHIIHR